MTAILHRIEDARDRLSKMRRWELQQYARHHGVPYDVQMPAPLLAQLLRSRGLNGADAPVPPRPLGQPNQPHARKLYNADGTPKVHVRPVQTEAPGEVNAEADLLRQWQEQQKQTAGKSLSDMGINELRAECKRLGIKLGRKDNMNTMREKIGAHG